MENRSGLSLEFRGSEVTPDNAKRYLSFRVQVNHEGFSGQTDFEVTKHDFACFVSEAKQFYETYSPVTELRAGWGNETHFHLKLSRFDLHGHVLMECQIRGSGVQDFFNSVQTYQVLELAQIQKVVAFGDAILRSDEPDTLTIS